MKKLIGILLFISAVASNAATPIANDSTFAFIDILQWQPREAGADNWAQVFNISSGKTTVRLVDAPFPWNTGVRVGVGRTFYQTNDILFAYTHYQTTAKSVASGIVASAFDGAYFADNVNGASLGIAYRNANARWQFDYNTVDLNVGHHFVLDSVLQLHPFIGLKGASINQTVYTNWFTPTVAATFTKAAENLTNDFSGFGPMLGTNSTWTLVNGNDQSFSLIGNLAAGLLYGHWHFKEIYTNDKPVKITVFVSSVNGASPVVDGLLGVQWLKQFSQSNISVRLGYEAQFWFNQMQFYSLSMGRVNRSLTMQGGNLDFQYNF